MQLLACIFLVICADQIVIAKIGDHDGVLEKHNELAAGARISRVGRLGTPKCSCAYLSCNCCLQATRLKSPPICVRASYNINELKMAVDVEVDGKRVGGKSIGPEAIPFCLPAAPLYICLTANKVYFTSESARVCLRYSIKAVGSDLYKGTFPCFQMANGQFSLSSNRDITQ